MFCFYNAFLQEKIRVKNKISHAGLCLRAAWHKVGYAQNAAQKWGLL